MQEIDKQNNANIEKLHQYIQTREEEVSKSLTQLALLQLGLQRCRRLKSALMSQEQQLREHLDALNSQTTDPRIVRARQIAVRNLLAVRPALHPQILVNLDAVRKPWKQALRSKPSAKHLK